MRRNRVARIAGISAIAVGAIAVVGEVVHQLWNWLMPELFGWHTIGFWQALGLLALTKILFGGFRGRGGSGMRWRQRMKERWAQMSPQEREEFKKGMAARCGGMGFGERGASA